MMQLVLYTTSYCHLCEQAEALLISLKDQTDINWQLTEISEDEFLTNKFGIRIPVLMRLDNQHELNWPFTENDILQLIQS